MTAAMMQLADKRPCRCCKPAAPRCTTDTVLYTLHQCSTGCAAAHVTTPYLILLRARNWVWCENKYEVWCENNHEVWCENSYEVQCESNSGEDLPARTPQAYLAGRLPLAAWLPAHVQGQPALPSHHALPAASMPCPAAHEHAAPAAGVHRPGVTRPIGFRLSKIVG